MLSHRLLKDSTAGLTTKYLMIRYLECRKKSNLTCPIRNDSLNTRSDKTNFGCRDLRNQFWLKCADIISRASKHLFKYRNYGWIIAEASDAPRNPLRDLVEFSMKRTESRRQLGVSSWYRLAVLLPEVRLSLRNEFYDEGNTQFGEV